MAQEPNTLLPAGKIVKLGYKIFPHHVTSRAKPSDPLPSVAMPSRREPLASNGPATLKRLHELSTRVFAIQNIEAALTEVLEAAMELGGAEFGIVQLIDESSSELKLSVERGAVPEVRQMRSVPLVGSDNRRLGMLSTNEPEAGGIGEAEGSIILELCAQQAVASIERLRAAERGHESERRYKALFESIDHAFAVVEVLFDQEGEPTDYRFLETNPEYLRHTGLQDAVGRTGLDLVPQLQPFWVETFGRVALTGQSERFTEPVRGLERWLDCYAFRLGHPRNRQVAIFFKDVTEERLAEQLNQFLVSLDDATRNLVDPEEISATVTRLLGKYLQVDRVVYTEVDEGGVVVMGEWSPPRPPLLGPYRCRDHEREFGTALRSGRPFYVEDIAESELTAEERKHYAAHQITAMAQVPLHKGGKLRSSLAVYHGTRRHWRGREIELMLAVANRCWEAIERGRVANRLRDSEEQFRTLSNSLPQFIWTARPDGYIYWFNEYAHEFFGRAAKIEGLGWMQFHDPELLPDIERGYVEALAAGRSYSCTTRFRNAAGEYRWLIARMVPQRDEHGNVLRFLGYNFDVTELYETQARLVEADRRKDEFLATLAHELRNPLAPLYSILEVLKLKPGEGMTSKLREMMLRQVNHLGRLVDDLLDASRITRGVVELKRERVLLGGVLGLAIETSRPLIEARSHRLRVDAPDEILWLEADAVRLTQVFANLLNNAAKYTDENGQIGINVSAEKGHAVVTVSDNGVGIASDMLERVFELFTQVDRQSGRAQGGLGIGLSLSRKLVEMHGGSLEGTSDGIGRGSSFTVRLPLSVSGDPVTAGRIPQPDSPAENRLKLLVVDDNVDAAESLGALLGSLGGEVCVVYDGPSALDLLERERFSAAFLDLGMPVVDGLELARRIRASGRFGDLLLVAVTGWGQDQDRARSRDAGFDHHLVKPAEVTALQTLLRGLPANAPGIA